MPMTKEQLIDKLRAAGVQFDVHEHAPVLTVQAQVRVSAAVVRACVHSHSIMHTLPSMLRMCVRIG
mgnify:CR=1 FL=1